MSGWPEVGDVVAAIGYACLACGLAAVGWGILTAPAREPDAVEEVDGAD